MCLFAVLAAFFPRVAFLIYWIARPNVVDAVFGTFIWPFLGLLFLPFTTLIYTVLWSRTGLTGSDWLWVGIALLLDIGHYASSTYFNRNRIPGMTYGG
jgi:hypothetical protein